MLSRAEAELQLAFGLYGKSSRFPIGHEERCGDTQVFLDLSVLPSSARFCVSRIKTVCSAFALQSACGIRSKPPPLDRRLAAHSNILMQV